MSGDKQGRAWKVLVVEDDMLVAHGVAGVVEEAGMVVCGIARSEGEAARLAAACMPDLAIVDIRLASGDTGVRAAALIRQHFATVILVASAYCEAHRHQFPAETLFIQKPFSAGELKAAMAAALGDARPA